MREKKFHEILDGMGGILHESSTEGENTVRAILRRDRGRRQRRPLENAGLQQKKA